MKKPEPELGTTKVTPVAYLGAGYSEVSDGEQAFYSVSIYLNEPRYGEGWFPLYADDADAYGHMYVDKAKAYAAAGLEME